MVQCTRCIKVWWLSNLWFSKVYFVVDERGQIMFGVFQYEKDTIQILSHCYILEFNNIWMLQCAQKIYFSDAADWKTIFWLVNSHSFQRKYLFGLGVSRSIHHSISALTNSVQFLKFTHMSTLAKLIDGKKVNLWKHDLEMWDCVHTRWFLSIENDDKSSKRNISGHIPALPSLDIVI